LWDKQVIPPSQGTANTLFQHLEITAARIAEDLDIFETLANSNTPLTSVELASKKAASPLLTSESQSRLIGFLCLSWDGLLGLTLASRHLL
jgi:hypothetical protein